MTDLARFLKEVSALVERWVDGNLFTKHQLSANLYESMKYSLNAGGKRLRPALVLLGYNLFSKSSSVGSIHPALPFAAAVEMIHTYSLIHDDLPSMDNDDMRRGKPTNHKVFGDATAILAGDGLLTKGMEIFTDERLASGISAEYRMKAAFAILNAVGADGMVGGQYVDIASDGGSKEHSTVELNSMGITKAELLSYIHTHKTAVFIAGAVSAGAILAGAADEDVSRVYDYGLSVGMAFQIMDDILDVISSTEELGKPVGSDDKLDKLTYPKLLGMDGARAEADRLVQKALDIMSVYAHHLKGDASVPNKSAALLCDLAEYTVSRRS